MPRGVYKRKKKTKAQQAEINARAAATRKANREAAQLVSKAVKAKAAKRTKRFLSDDEKGKVVSYFFGKPGRTYANWGAVATDIQEQLGIRLSGKQAERLREAFSLPFDVAGATDGEAVCEKRLQRIEQILTQMKAKIDEWE